MEQLARQSDRLIRYIGVTGHHGPAAARNAGWKTAHGKIIAFTDDDCLPQPEWLQEGLAVLDLQNADAAWGKLSMPLPPEPTDYERDAAGLASAVFVTANCFCRRKAIEQVGGFDERFTAAWREDSDLYFSLLKHQFKVIPAPRAHVVHPIRPAPWGISLWQQRKSQFDALLYRKHPEYYRQYIAAFPRDYYLISAALVLMLFGVLSRSWLTVVLAVAIWLIFTARFCQRRLAGTSKAPRHLREMLVTSVLIPPLSLYWRLRGAIRFRTLFF